MNLKSKVTLHTGNKMPIIGLGTWKLLNDTPGTVAEALKMGYPMIDTSGDYGTQPGIAKALKLSGVPRSYVYIVTKIEEYVDAYEATKTNLRELEIDYADLVLIHRPPPDGIGEELWQGLIRARREGLTRDIGISNYSAEQTQALIRATNVVPVVNQIEWSPFGHSNEMLEYCREHKIIIQAYSPLTRGDRDDEDTLKEIASHYGKTTDQVMIRWNLQLGTVPLPKANHIEHQRENIDVFDFDLTDEDMAKLDALNEQYSALGSLPYV